MRREGGDYRILDKDLQRLTHAELAQMHAVRPVLRLGAGVLVFVALLLLAFGLSGRQDQVLMAGAGLIVAGWLGLSIGANDVGNALGPAVGSGALRLATGLALVALAEIAGATLAGHAVAQQLAAGIFDPVLLGEDGRGPLVMLAALIAAAVWITVATAIGVPVSTSHSIVGAISGAGVAAIGAANIHWGTVARIATAWVLAPMVSALVAGGLLVLVHRHVSGAPDRPTAARRWLPPMIGAMTGLFAAYVATLLRFGLPLGGAALVGIVAGLVAAAMTRLRIDAAIRDHARQGSKLGTKRIFGPGLIFAAVIMAFAHGANDAGNVAGPLSIILGQGSAEDVGRVPVLLICGGALIALGAVLFGRRLVVMVGSGITRLNPARAFCVTLSTALIVLIASGSGLPVSSTHVAVGGIFGVGFAREWMDRRQNRRRAPMPQEETQRRRLIRRSHVITITAAWLVTVPLTMGLGAGIAALILWSRGV